MRKFIAAVLVLLISFGMARATDLFGHISKVDGNQITLLKGFKKEGEAITLMVADDCKVTRRANYDPALKTIVDRGEPLEGGFGSRLVKKSTSIFAIITEEGGKVTQVNIINLESKHFFAAGIVKVEAASKVTIRERAPMMKFVERTLTVADKVKVTHIEVEGKKRKVTVLADGLKNELFSSTRLFASFETDDDDRITQIEVFSLIPGKKK
jgi:hypothetical protein